MARAIKRNTPEPTEKVGVPEEKQTEILEQYGLVKGQKVKYYRLPGSTKKYAGHVIGISKDLSVYIEDDGTRQGRSVLPEQIVKK